MIMGISLKELKKNRLTPAEKWVLKRIEGAEPTTLSNGNVEWCDKDGKWVLQQDLKNGVLEVSWTYIWSVLEKQFALNYGEIKELINNVMYDYTNNGTLTAVSSFSFAIPQDV